jgi:hypothetical protein
MMQSLIKPLVIDIGNKKIIVELPPVTLPKDRCKSWKAYVVGGCFIETGNVGMSLFLHGLSNNLLLAGIFFAGIHVVEIGCYFLSQCLLKMDV